MLLFLNNNYCWRRKSCPTRSVSTEYSLWMRFVDTSHAKTWPGKLGPCCCWAVWCLYRSLAFSLHFYPHETLTDFINCVRGAYPLLWHASIRTPITVFLLTSALVERKLRFSIIFAWTTLGQLTAELSLGCFWIPVGSLGPFGPCCALSIVPREACRALLGTPAAPYILHLLRQCVKPSAAAGMRGRPRVRLGRLCGSSSQAGPLCLSCRLSLCQNHSVRYHP